MRGKNHTRLISSCLLLALAVVILCGFSPARAASPPVIQSMNTNVGTVGDYVLVNGTGFGSEQGSSKVSFGPFPSSAYSSWSDTQIRCQIPGLPGVPLPVTGTVTVTTPNGTSNAVSFTVRKPPTVAAIWPPMGFEGAIVDASISGSGFQPGATLEFYFQGMNSNSVIGGVGVSNVTVVSDTVITCRLGLPRFNTLSFPPTYSVAYRVSVKNRDGGVSTDNIYFNVTINPCGAGAGASIGTMGLLMGTLSLAGAFGVRRRRRKKP